MLNYCLYILFIALSFCIDIAPLYPNTVYENDKAYSISYNPFFFDVGSIELKPSTRAKLDSLVLEMKANRWRYNNTLIYVASNYCKAEAEIDPFIGVKRAKIVKDYLILSLKDCYEGIEDMFLIMDNVRPSKNMTISIEKCEEGTVFVQFTPRF